jgi:hypothetical protein
VVAPDTGAALAAAGLLPTPPPVAEGSPPEPGPLAAAERAAIQAEPALPPAGSPERAAADQRQAQAVAGHLAAGMQRPPAWANVSLTPPMGAWCSCCRGRRWWTERGPIRSGWRCVVCRPPLHLRPEDVMERQT